MDEFTTTLTAMAASWHINHEPSPYPDETLGYFIDAAKSLGLDIGVDDEIGEEVADQILAEVRG